MSLHFQKSVAARSVVDTLPGKRLSGLTRQDLYGRLGALSEHLETENKNGTNSPKGYKRERAKRAAKGKTGVFCGGDASKAGPPKNSSSKENVCGGGCK